MRIRLKIVNLGCANCAAKIERAVNEMEHVRNASLNFQTSILSADIDDGHENLIDEIKRIASSIEHRISFVDLDVDVNDGPSRKEIVKTLIPPVLFFVILSLDITGILYDSMSWILYVIVYILAGYKVLISAIRNIIALNPMDELFLMSVASAGAVLIGHPLEAAAVMSLFTVGELLEDIAVGKSRRSIKAITDIEPQIAHLVVDGIIADKTPTDIPVGSVILIKPGERIPLDGTVTMGFSDIDTSPITGEHIPVFVSQDSKVISGSVNLSGSLYVKTSGTYSESTVHRILELIEDAGNKKSSSERFITRFSRIYTPIVVSLAVLIAVIPTVMGLDFGEWIYRALTFLVLSCPCALVLSVPLTVMCGIGCASSNGILLKGGNYLEMLSKIEKMAFDKTGTITTGKLSVHSTVSDDEELMTDILSSLESNSNHPISKAITEKFPTDLKAYGIKEISGKGITGTVDGKSVAAGNPSLMESLGIHVKDDDITGTKVHVSYDGRYLGYVVLRDSLKPCLKESLTEIKSLGVKEIIMLTGDRNDVAKEVASSLPIDAYFAELLPGDKVDRLESIMERGEGLVAFVGDGINDAPVLRRSDIGISMGSMGSDAAIESSDVIIVSDDISKIAESIRISKRTMSIVKQNIVFSLGMKVLMLVVTFLGFGGMFGAVFADVGVCLIAVLNSLRALKSKDHGSD